MKALVLDFDGVISSSGREALVVACSTYLAIRPPTRLVDMDPRQVSNEFYRMMPLCQRAEDYAVIIAAIESGVPLKTQASFDRLRASQDLALLEAFHDHFYDTRAAFRQDDPTGWRDLFEAYDPVVAMLRSRAGTVPYAIASAKDRSSILTLLDDYGIRDLVPDELVLDKQTGKSKSTHLDRVHQILDLPFDQIVFVDDKLSHLYAAAALGVRCILADWGYNSEREQQQAIERGYDVCSLETIETELFRGF